jgi:membrane protein implicated in regulation of membrane protease activity
VSADPFPRSLIVGGPFVFAVWMTVACPVAFYWSPGDWFLQWATLSGLVLCWIYDTHLRNRETAQLHRQVEEMQRRIEHLEGRSASPSTPAP